MKTNLFRDLPVDVSTELVQTLIEQPGVRIERIVSTGQASPPGFWYDQSEAEWVILLAGAARLRFESPAEVVELAAGDCLNIEAHRRHRVDWTSPDEPTLWIAVFYGQDTPLPNNTVPTTQFGR